MFLKACIQVKCYCLRNCRASIADFIVFVVAEPQSPILPPGATSLSKYLTHTFFVYILKIPMAFWGKVDDLTLTANTYNYRLKGR